ncbi:MAG: hypothetical protein ACOC4G_07240 [Bacillota bacterium]
MTLHVEMEPEKGKAGSKVKMKVTQTDVEEYSEYAKLMAIGQPFTKRLSSTDEEGVFTGESTIPYGAYPGKYNLKVKTIGGTEEETKVSYQIT